jgi:phospholipase C
MPPSFRRALVETPQPLPEPIVRQASEIRRVSRQDLDGLRPWLGARLAKLYPHATEPQVFWFLCSILSENAYWFVRNDVAIGMANLLRDPLSRPRVVERFVLAIGYDGRDGDNEMDLPDVEADEAALTLYPSMIQWARSQECERVTVTVWSDAVLSHVERKIGKTNHMGQRVLML